MSEMGHDNSQVLQSVRQVVSPVTGRTYELRFVVERGKEIVLVAEAPKVDGNRT